MENAIPCSSNHVITDIRLGELNESTTIWMTDFEN